LSEEHAGQSRKGKPRRGGGPVSMGAALRDLTHRLGIVRTLSEYDVLTSWDALVGEQIARVARPERFENGTLFVAVGSAPWRAELSMRRMEILERINGAIGRKVVKELRFR
jgi:predicted nucleic acid-binding Zn ribbon protein